jgi:hypothetical protein
VLADTTPSRRAVVWLISITCLVNGSCEPFCEVLLLEACCHADICGVAATWVQKGVRTSMV